MLKIGEFAKTARVSVKTLRYYDECGLLKPAWKDRFSGYRYYHLSQLSELNRILALKELGFTLEQIQMILGESITISQIKAMLHLKQAELEEEIKATQTRMALIESRLKQMENGADLEQITRLQTSTLPDQIGTKKESNQMDVKIQERPAFQVAGVEYFGKNENGEIPAMWNKDGDSLDKIKHTTQTPVQEWFGVCGDMQDDGRFRYLMAVEVSIDDDLPAGMASWDIPQQTYAVFPCTLSGIHKAYEYAHGTWMPEYGYKRADGPDFEYYDEHFNPADPESMLYIYIPVRK